MHMKHWKTTVKRKKIQRHINSVIKQINRNIERDELWLGRFYCQQQLIRFYNSEDGGYTYATVAVEFIDRKTGKIFTHWFHKEDFMGTAWRIWEAMNDFIVTYCRVWAEVPPPSIQNVWDYRKEIK